MHLHTGKQCHTPMFTIPTGNGQRIRLPFWVLFWVPGLIFWWDIPLELIVGVALVGVGVLLLIRREADPRKAKPKNDDRSASEDLI